MREGASSSIRPGCTTTGTASYSRPTVRVGAYHCSSQEFCELQALELLWEQGLTQFRVDPGPGGNRQGIGAMMAYGRYHPRRHGRAPDRWPDAPLRRRAGFVGEREAPDGIRNAAYDVDGGDRSPFRRGEVAASCELPSIAMVMVSSLRRPVMRSNSGSIMRRQERVPPRAEVGRRLTMVKKQDGQRRISMRQSTTVSSCASRRRLP